MDLNIHDSVKTLGVTYKMNAGKLEKLGIKTVEDLILHVPSRYDDLSIISPISLLQADETATVKGIVLETKYIFTKNRKRIQYVLIQDASQNKLGCLWFNQMFILRLVKPGDIISVAGKVIFFQNKIAMIVNGYEILPSLDSPTIHTGRLVPVYPETRGLSSKWIRNRIKELLPEIKKLFNDYLPDCIIQRQKFPDLITAIENVHFPKDKKIAEVSKNRLAFDEFFLTQLTALFRRSEWEEKTTTYSLKISPFKEQIQKFWESLPFELTNAQKKAIKEIFRDFASTRPMNRLLEGDVGSGKTVVAAMGAYIVHLNGLQTVIMAPTEILANQHYETISKLLTPFKMKVGLITGSEKYLVSGISYLEKNKKLNTKYLIQNTDILVGTHALLNEKLKFDKLGFVVIDEQQRFGVEQRTILRDKGMNPHFLTMTATPIPRTIFLTLFGDLDLSYLDEMPKGRIKIKTWLVPGEKREPAYDWIKKKIKELDVNGHGNQVFIICPFIEESENAVTIKAAVKEYENLKNIVFKDFSIGLLHGKLKAKEKACVLQDFRNRKIDVLVATPVVEVGIDIPNATIMLIEAAERFGLAQLHQLRGRVGRGEKASFCLLFTDSNNQKTIQRLKCLETTHLGGQLAEMDLRLRGPGEIFGVLQHGTAKLKVASFSDFELIETTKKEAENILPKLSQYPRLLEKVKSYKVENISPD